MNIQILISFFLVFFWMALKVYEAAAQNDIVDIFVVMILLLMIVGSTFSFPLRQLIKAHMPYLILILIWGLIDQVIILVTNPSAPKSIALLSISFTLYVYVWHKTKGKRKIFFSEMKKMKQK